jgi:cobalt-zinc-cadmium efflux system outer membrane protein
MEFQMVVSFARSVCACVCILSSSAVSPSMAAENPLPMTLQDAIVRSLEHNPDFKAFAFELEAQLGTVRQAGARASPEVSLLVENALGSGERSGFNAAETTLSLGFLIEHGARRSRLETARAGGQWLDSEAAVRRLDLAAETTRRYLALLILQEELNELGKATMLAEETLAAVQARIRAAKAPQAEEARAYAQISRVRLQKEDAEHELAAAKQKLAALWGSTQVDFGPAQGALHAMPPLESFPALRERLERNPEFERLICEKRLREAELTLAETRRRLPWQVTAGVRRFEVGSDHALVLGISVPLPVRDQTEGAIATARANASQVDAQRIALRARLDAELFALYQELRHSYSQVSALRDDVIPRMETAVEQSRYAYERGRYSYIEWVAAQRELLELRRELLEASANVHRYRIELERLTGAALRGNPSP